ncbi:MAG: hypothetical protein AAFX87_20455, partial [Bacteroidota bacterium]
NPTAMMKTILLSFLFCAIIVSPSLAQEENKYAKDTESIDAIIAALYGVISGEKGVERDWDRFRALMIPEAKLIPSAKNQEGKVGYRIHTVEEYIKGANPYFIENGFFESELHRVTEQFGSVVHIFSTYQSKRSESDAEPFSRGINSIQLMHDGERWWILNIYWTAETEENPIPAKYLP